MENLSRRERQIMDIVYKRGQADASDIQRHLPDPPSYSTVRALLRILVEKEHLTFERKGQRYVYAPRVPAEKARGSALKHLVDTFFGGSPEQVVAALIEQSDLSDADLNRLTEMVRRAKQEGR